MSKTIYEPKPRYEVQVGEAEYIEGFDATKGKYETSLTGMCWSFDRAFTMEHDAITYAKLMAEDQEFVRVIDREA